MRVRKNEYRVWIVYRIPDERFSGAETEFADDITAWATDPGKAWLEIVWMAEALHYEIITAYEPVRVF